MAKIVVLRGSVEADGLKARPDGTYEIRIALAVA